MSDHKDIRERLAKCTADYCPPFYAQNVEELLADRDALAKRLEVTEYGPSTDGIACRDETIRLQDQRIDALARRLAEAEALLQEAAPWLRPDGEEPPKLRDLYARVTAHLAEREPGAAECECGPELREQGWHAATCPMTRSEPGAAP